MLIGLDPPFIFVANLKTASTAIEFGLRSAADIALVESRFDKHMPLQEIERRFSWVFETTDRRDFFTFGVIRDPVDFVISLYNSHSDEKFIGTTLYTGDMAFIDFIEGWAQKNDDQLVPQYTRFLSRDGSIGADFIISYARLDEGLQYVATRLGFPTSCKLPRLNTSERRFSREDLSAPQCEWISRRFHADASFITRFCDRPLTKVEKEWQVGPPRGEEIVKSIYRVFLLREPDKEGLATGLQMLGAGSNVEELMRWCLQSDEFGLRHHEFLRAHVRAEFRRTDARRNIDGRRWIKDQVTNRRRGNQSRAMLPRRPSKFTRP